MAERSHFRNTLVDKLPSHLKDAPRFVSSVFSMWVRLLRLFPELSKSLHRFFFREVTQLFDFVLLCQRHESLSDGFWKNWS